MNPEQQPSWLTTLSQVAGVGLAIVREVRNPSPTPLPALPAGTAGVQVSTTGSGVSVTTSPLLIVAAIAGLVAVVYMATK